MMTAKEDLLESHLIVGILSCAGIVEQTIGLERRLRHSQNLLQLQSSTLWSTLGHNWLQNWTLELVRLLTLQ